MSSGRWLSSLAVCPFSSCVLFFSGVWSVTAFRPPVTRPPSTIFLIYGCLCSCSLREKYRKVPKSLHEGQSSLNRSLPSDERIATTKYNSIPLGDLRTQSAPDFSVYMYKSKTRWGCFESSLYVMLLYMLDKNIFISNVSKIICRVCRGV